MVWCSEGAIDYLRYYYDITHHEAANLKKEKQPNMNFFSAEKIPTARLALNILLTTNLCCKYGTCIINVGFTTISIVCLIHPREWCIDLGRSGLDFSICDQRLRM